MNHSFNAPKAFYAGCRFVKANCVVAVMWLVLALASTALAQPSSPILRIETGMHTATIRRIGIDRDNRYLVTASVDKTVRVWELASGKLLRILRPPLDDGNEGRLYALAISPDGRTVAVGGYTGYDWDKHYSIYIFDRESGRMLRRITGLPQVINQLAYSHDGSRLAATLGGLNGVRVFDTAGYAQIFADSDYGNSSYSADFDSAGRLVTACDDDFLRLYDPTPDKRSLRRVTKRKIERGKGPFSVSFSPDASKIAVGFADSTRVTVVSGRDLSPLYYPSTNIVGQETLANVAWSADGQTLFAGGRYNSGSQIVIRCWTEGGRGKWQDVAASTGTIFHIVPLRDGGVIFCTADPAFGRLDANGNRIMFVTSVIADYRDLSESLLLSNDGTQLQFSYEMLNKSPARFFLGERQLLTDTQSSAPGDLKPPLTSGLPITDWEDTYAPKFNGQLLSLKPYEMSRSLAISADKTRFLLGTESQLRLFDRSGRQIWEAITPTIAWRVNISGDGRVAVAAFADGTIRWYRMSDGKEVLAFFPHKDRKRWVLWTPSGYYDTSAGGEDLIGWHINNGKDAAGDFYPAMKFRNTAYRPDVVGLILTTLDESLALAKANEESGRNRPQLNVGQTLPPVVSILSPADGAEVASSEITVRYLVRSPSGAEVRALRRWSMVGPLASVKGSPRNRRHKRTRFNNCKSAFRSRIRKSL